MTILHSSPGTEGSLEATPPGQADSATNESQVRGGALVKAQGSTIQPACDANALEPEVIVIPVRVIPDDSPPADPVPVTPYRIYGWNEARTTIWARDSATEQLFELPPPQSLRAFLKIHNDIGYWADRFPGKNGHVDFD